MGGKIVVSLLGVNRTDISIAQLGDLHRGLVGANSFEVVESSRTHSSSKA
jgi:hypothetical protein